MKDTNYQNPNNVKYQRTQKSPFQILKENNIRVFVCVCIYLNLYLYLSTSVYIYLPKSIYFQCLSQCLINDWDEVIFIEKSDKLILDAPLKPKDFSLTFHKTSQTDHLKKGLYSLSFLSLKSRSRLYYVFIYAISFMTTNYFPEGNSQKERMIKVRVIIMIR